MSCVGFCYYQPTEINQTLVSLYSKLQFSNFLQKSCPHTGLTPCVRFRLVTDLSTNSELSYIYLQGASIAQW